jgi:carboxypeptidase Q
MRLRRKSVLFLAAASLPLFLLAEETVDLSLVHAIKDEAFTRSKVMDHMFYLTEVNGPRLTNSAAYFAAAKWCADKMTEYGLVNAKLEKWGPFGRSWEMSRFSAHMTQPQYAPLIGFPLAWTESTSGAVTGEPMLVTLRTDADLEKWKGKLKGKIIMTEQPRALNMQMTAAGRRYTEAELAETAQAPEPGDNGMRMMARMAGPQMPGQPPPDRETMMAQFRQQREFRTKMQKFLKDEGVALVLQVGMRGDGGTIFGAQAGSQDSKQPLPPPTVALASEHYNRIARLLQHKIPVNLEIEAASKIVPEVDSVNVIAEIPGSTKKDELVMLGGHLDSWQGGTGATDNATGVAVVIEAVRIIKALNLQPKRTIRVGLWAGEEEGLLGSRAYVKEHFADPTQMKPTAEHAKLSGYFNYDNGSGKIRGIYLQGNEMVGPIFEKWLAPFKDLGAHTITVRNTSGTDHQAFDGVGLPGFQFIQDPLEYDTRTHHTNMDVYDRVQAGDLMQSAAIMATFVIQTANREEMLPRKPLPKPQVGRGMFGM